MANTLGGVNLAQIAQMTLETLLAEMPMLSAFTTDLSADIKEMGESVSTRLVTAVAAGSVAAGYTATDVTSVAKIVTLNLHKGFVMAFTDLEVAKATLPFLQRVFIRPAAWSVANAFMDDLLALVTIANFSNGEIIATVDADEAANLATDLTTLNVRKQDRSLLLGPALYNTLVKDNAIQQVFSSGSDQTVRENKSGRVHGFNVIEYTDIPSNGQSLTGIACGKEALLFAARLPALPQNWFGEVETVTDPDSGLSLQFRSWYEGKDGKQFVAVTVIYGVAVGNASALKRITSA